MSYFSSSSIKYYYSGAASVSGTQIDPTYSLGGFISSSEVPADSLSSLFSNAGGLDVIAGSEQYRALFVKNTSALEFYNASVFFYYRTSSAYDLVYFGVDACLKLLMDACR